MATPPTFHEAIAAHPVMSVQFGPERLQDVLQADAQAVTVSSIELRHLSKLVEVMREYGKTVFVNIDAIAGISQDRGGVMFLESVGVSGVITTRGSLISRIQGSGMVAMQKVFVTDRTNLARMQDSVGQSNPDYVQMMPLPVVNMLTPEELAPFKNIIAAGFIRNLADVKVALENGAVGVSSSTVELWSKSGIQGLYEKK